MLNPQTEIKFSDYNSLYDILNPTVNGFRDFSLSFLIDYKAGASLSLRHELLALQRGSAQGYVAWPYS